ncbi:MAG: hypothetical protein ACOCV2_03970, partial [Persicimonas sp.]
DASDAGRDASDAGRDASDAGRDASDVEDAGECEPESDEEFCERLGAECGEVDDDDNCGNARSVDCGGCEGDAECGLTNDNVCNCPCEIDDGCQAEGDASEDNPCMVCDPDESTSEYSPADDGIECGDNAICDDGQCTCEDGFQDCGEDGCVDFDNDVDHCGACDTECTTNIEDSSPTCVQGACNVTCDDPDETPCISDEVCTDTDTDDDHCGNCFTSCNSGESCDDGDCVD